MLMPLCISTDYSETIKTIVKRLPFIFAEAKLHPKSFLFSKLSPSHMASITYTFTKAYNIGCFISTCYHSLSWAQTTSLPLRLLLELMTLKPAHFIICRYGQRIWKKPPWLRLFSEKDIYNFIWLHFTSFYSYRSGPTGPKIMDKTKMRKWGGLMNWVRYDFRNFKEMGMLHLPTTW